MKSLIVTILLVAVVGHKDAFALKPPACPPEDAIRPCTCSNNSTLTCSGIVNGQVLRHVFKNITGRTVSVRIENSTFQYIPHEIFNRVKVENLTINGTTIVDLFDIHPENLHTLQQLFIVNSKIMRNYWPHLNLATKLKTLYFENTAVGALDYTFIRLIPASLEQLAIHGGKIKSIKPGAFKRLRKLRVLSIKESGLPNLERNMFPAPSYVEYLFFSGNKLTSIPDDLFSRMPKLQVVDLSKNQLTTIPEKAFDGHIRRIELLALDDNLLSCDCGLHWLARIKPKEITGTCHSPGRMRGRKLKTLINRDFNC